MADGNRAWLDRVAGLRMEFDSEFSEVVADSPFTNQQWGLIMTAAEFRIQTPEDPEAAELLPVTEKLPAIMDQVEQLDEGMGGLGGGRRGAGGGIVDSVRDRLGIGDGDDELVEAAEAMLAQYADGFQERLVAEGRWDEVCEIAAED